MIQNNCMKNIKESRHSMQLKCRRENRTKANIGKSITFFEIWIGLYSCRTREENLSLRRTFLGEQ